VLVVLGFSPLVVAGPRSFAGELLTDCGATNAAASATVPYPVWSMERVAASPPEIVIDATDVPNGRERVEQLSGKARWGRLTDLSLLQPGPALARALDELCGTLASPSTSTRETP
jgi:ABC-type Fe3+-hydroxamate transport system substrate-binding protein